MGSIILIQIVNICKVDNSRSDVKDLYRFEVGHWPCYRLRPLHVGFIALFFQDSRHTIVSVGWSRVWFRLMIANRVHDLDYITCPATTWPRIPYPRRLYTASQNTSLWCVPGLKLEEKQFPYTGINYCNSLLILVTFMITWYMCGLNLLFEDILPQQKQEIHLMLDQN